MPVPEGARRPNFRASIELLGARLAANMKDGDGLTGLPPGSRIVDVEWDGKNGCVIFYYEPT